MHGYEINKARITTCRQPKASITTCDWPKITVQTRNLKKIKDQTYANNNNFANKEG